VGRVGRPRPELAGGYEWREVPRIIFGCCLLPLVAVAAVVGALAWVAVEFVFVPGPSEDPYHASASLSDACDGNLFSYFPDAPAYAGDEPHQIEIYEGYNSPGVSYTEYYGINVTVEIGELVAGDTSEAGRAAWAAEDATATQLIACIGPTGNEQEGRSRCTSAPPRCGSSRRGRPRKWRNGRISPPGIRHARTQRS
jgi:hypothetical protein